MWWPVFCSHRVLNNGAKRQVTDVRLRRARRLVIWCKWLNKVTVRCGLVVVRCAIQMHSAVSQPHPTHPRPCCTLRVFVSYLYRLARQSLVPLHVPSSLRLLHIVWDVNKYDLKKRLVLICLSVLRTDQCHHIKVIQYRRVYIMALNFDCQLGKSGTIWNEWEFGWTKCCMFEYDLALVNEFKIVTILFYCDDLNAILYVVWVLPAKKMLFVNMQYKN